MTTYRYHYPGDPICEATEMTTLEFRVTNPNRAVEVYDFDGSLQARYPVNDVVCDSCNALCPDDAIVTLSLHRLWCADCARQWLHPYRLVEPHSLKDADVPL